MISYPDEVLKTIISGWVPNYLALGIVNTFNIELALLVNPIGHGTSSEYLDSIIKHSLGGYIPKNAWQPNKIAVAKLHQSGGIECAYAFALREEVFGIFRKNLSIDVSKSGGRNIIPRYISSIGLSGIQKYIGHLALSFVGARYCIKRGKKKGWPIILIYDVNDSVSLVKKGRTAPPEYYASQTIPAEYLKLILVPAVFIDETLAILDLHNVNCSVVPMEILELQEQIR